eukprot:6630495-Alexandrium_andersonii.AAC.1
MSASLVGSEMCIRDSSPADTASVAGASLALAHRYPSCQGRCGGRGWRPVSYTHLTLPTICSV